MPLVASTIDPRPKTFIKLIPENFNQLGTAFLLFLAPAGGSYPAGHISLPCWEIITYPTVKIRRNSLLRFLSVVR